MTSDLSDRHDGPMKLTTGTQFGSCEMRIFRQVIVPLRVSLGLVWLATGLLCVGGTAEGLELIRRVGLQGSAALWTIRLTSALEIILAFVIFSGRWPQWIAVIQLVLIAGFTVIVSFFLPEFWLHPFGPITKNVVLAAAAYGIGKVESEFSRVTED